MKLSVLQQQPVVAAQELFFILPFRSATTVPEKKPRKFLG
jgi:hypothetical protein